MKTKATHQEWERWTALGLAGLLILACSFSQRLSGEQNNTPGARQTGSTATLIEIPTITVSSPTLEIHAPGIDQNGAKAPRLPVPFVRPNVNGNAMGDPNAPVMVEELADFQCSYCASFNQAEEPRLVEIYVKTGKVYFVYRPVALLGAESTDAAKASFCAMGQSKFWEYNDVLFTNQQGENTGGFSPARLQDFAISLSLDLDKFNQCMQSSKVNEDIQGNMTYAKAVGLQGTPSFVVNGKLVLSADLFAAIEAVLAPKP